MDTDLIQITDRLVWIPCCKSVVLTVQPVAASFVTNKSCRNYIFFHLDISTSNIVCVCVCVCVCARACVRACVRACAPRSDKTCPKGPLAVRFVTPASNCPFPRCVPACVSVCWCAFVARTPASLFLCIVFIISLVGLFVLSQRWTEILYCFVYIVYQASARTSVSCVMRETKCGLIMCCRCPCLIWMAGMVWSGKR